jgi:hypothetical protein
MDIFDFIKRDELEELPDDPQLAFARFVEIAEPRLIARLGEIDDGNSDNWNLIRDAEHGFQNVVLSAARKFNIAPLAKEDVPLVRNYDDHTYRQFRADLSHCLTQIMLAQAERDRSDSIPLLQKTKQSLHSYIYYLREAIDGTDLPDWKKKRLHKQLNEFESELTRNRFRVNVAFGVIAAILAATADLGPAHDTVTRLANTIMRELGTATEQDHEQRHISRDPPSVLLPPRRKEKSAKNTKIDMFDRSELDDEIPF